MTYKDNKLRLIFSLLTIVITVFTQVSNTFVFARQPDIVQDLTSQAIVADRQTEIPFSFSYGSIVSDSNIENAVANIIIDGKGLEFVNTSFEDWYYGDPTNTSAATPPQQPACNSSYTGPKYKISPSLVTKVPSSKDQYNNITYGIQSARSVDIASGGSTVDKLIQKHTGCLRGSLKVSKDAVAGDFVDIIFDEDFANSPTYTTDKRPGKQIIKLAIGKASSSSSSKTVSSSSSSVSSVMSSSTTSSIVPAVKEVPRSGGNNNLFLVFCLVSFTILGFLGYKFKTKKPIEINLGSND
jgi:hypothetical protein